jgi:anti-repressor protein
MNELIKIENKGGIETVNARKLHEFLRSQRDFSNWIKERIEKYGFIEGESYTTILANRSDGRAGKPRMEYYITLNMAKELSMVENNDNRKIWIC